MGNNEIYYDQIEEVSASAKKVKDITLDNSIGDSVLKLAGGCGASITSGEDSALNVLTENDLDQNCFKFL